MIPESLVHIYAPLCKAHIHSSNPRYDGFFANKMDATVCTGMIEVDGEDKPCEPKSHQNEIFSEPNPTVIGSLCRLMENKHETTT